MAERSSKSTLKFGKRVPKTKQYPNGWVSIYKYGKAPYVQESLLGHKSVVCFPGDGAISDKEMNGYCKNIQYMLKNAGVSDEDMPDLYSVGFDTDTVGHRHQLLDQAGSTRYGLYKKPAYQDYWTPFFDAYIYPLIQSEDRQPRPISQAMQNLQNVTFVTHCHGSMFAQQMEQLLNEKVKEFYPGREKEVMGNIRMVHFASRKEIGQDTGVKHFNVVSLADDNLVDYDLLAEDNIYKLLQKQSIDERSAIIPITDNETIMVFKELTTPKTYGKDGDEHSHILTITAGRNIKSECDEEALANEPALQFVRSMLMHFVEHSEDTRSVREIMKDVDGYFVAENIQNGRKIISGMEDAKHFDKSLLDLLSQYSLRDVGGEAQLYLQKTSDGKYFYEQVKEQAQKTGDFTSFRALLKRVKGSLSLEIRAQEINEAVQRKDRKTVDMLITGIPVYAIPKYILAKANTEDLSFLYPEIKRANLAGSGQKQMIDALLKKAEKIQNSSDRIRVMGYLTKEKEKSEAAKAPRIVRSVPTR